MIISAVSCGVMGLDILFNRQLAVGSWQLAVGSWQLAKILKIIAALKTILAFY